jgi:hypothetical protein
MRMSPRPRQPPGNFPARSALLAVKENNNMRALHLAGLGLLVSLAGCSTWNEARFVSDDPAVADVLNGEVEPEGPWITGEGQQAIWTDEM